MKKISEELKKKYFYPYQDLFEKINKSLKIRTPFTFDLATGFSFQIPKNQKKFILYSPPYEKQFEPLFIHYLCHAKMLEDGWLMPDIHYRLSDDAFREYKVSKAKWKALSKKEKKAIYFTWQNRSADSFFDFYVWQFVTEKFGKKIFLNFTSKTPTQKPKEIIEVTKKYNKYSQFPFTSYAIFIDWFVMFYMVAKKVHPKRAEELDKLFKKIIKRKDFIALVPSDFVKRIYRLREFYAVLGKKYPSYRELVKDRKGFEQAFREYYSIVWEGTGLRTSIR